MSLKLLVLLVFVTSQVSCEKKGSLALVIDNTYSMGDDISAVKEHMVNLYYYLNDKSASHSFEEVVVVTFNDPDINHVTRTRDVQKLTQALDNIKAHGGGDCPEMALSGIKLALEESLLKSHLYVITDASAKDYGKFEEIIALCQEKQSQITFFLTGNCQTTNSKMDTVYNNIAQACNGEVLRISKNELSQTFENLKEKVYHGNIIASITAPAHQWSEVKFFKNESIDYVLVSATGTGVKMYLLDQNRAALTAGEQVLWLNNVKILKLKNLPNGEITVTVRGTSNVNVQVVGKFLEPSVQPNN